jgi:hypothetical protein
LQPAVPAVVQPSAGHALQEIEETAVHLVDSVRLLQAGNAEGSALRTTCGFAQMHRPLPRKVLLTLAAATLENRKIAETLEERPMHPMQTLAALKAFLSHA